MRHLLTNADRSSQRPIDFNDPWQAMAALEFLARRSVPLIQMKDGRPTEIGTGTLVRIAEGATFLVTAAHVLEEATRPGTLLTIPAAGRGRVALPGLVPLLEGVRADRADVGIVRVSSEDAQRLGSVYEIIGLRDLMTFTAPFRNEFLICGYPLVHQAFRAEAAELTAFAHRSTAYEGESPRELHRRGEVHLEREPLEGVDFLVDCPSMGINGRGETVVAPRLHGMSGAALWGMVEQGEAWSPSTLRVMGVQTGTVAGRWIRCTSWPLVARGIADNWPELRPALEAIFGSQTKE